MISQMNTSTYKEVYDSYDTQLILNCILGMLRFYYYTGAWE